MAEVTGLRNNALPYPIYGAPFGVTFPLLDADGDPISPSAPDSEISKNGDTFADCTNEATEIATSSGSCYLLLTGTELTCDVATIQAKSTGAKTTVLTLYPRKLVTIRAGTSASAGSATDTIVLDASASAIDDFYNGMVCIATIDSNLEVRVISDYVGSTQTATVVPDWNVAPDNNDTFVVKLPEGVQLNQANATHWNHLVTVELPLVPTTAGRKLDVSAGGEAGLDWANIGSPTTTVNLSGTNIKTDQKVDVETIKTNPVANGGTVTFPTNATLASTTNITAGTITTVTNLTNAPTNGDLTATMKTSVQTAADAAITANAVIISLQSDTNDIQTRLPAALTGDGNIKSDTLRISGSAESADRLERSTLAIVTGTCDAGGTTTAIIASALSPTSAVNDQFNGRIISFSHDTTTAALRGQSTDITDYVHATLTFTVTALTTAPASGDLFVIT